MESQATHHCSYCGAPLAGEAMCPRCGRQLLWDGDAPAPDAQLPAVSKAISRRRRKWLLPLLIAGAFLLLGIGISLPVYRASLGYHQSPEKLVEGWNQLLRQGDEEAFSTLFDSTFSVDHDVWTSLTATPFYLEFQDVKMGSEHRCAQIQVKITYEYIDMHTENTSLFAIREDGKWKFTTAYIYR